MYGACLACMSVVRVCICYMYSIFYMTLDTLRCCRVESMGLDGPAGSYSPLVRGGVFYANLRRAHTRSFNHFTITRLDLDPFICKKETQARIRGGGSEGVRMPFPGHDNY